MCREFLPIIADGSQVAPSEAEVRRRDPGVADVRLRLLCGRRGLEKDPPVRLGSDGRQREGLVEGLKGNLGDYAGRRSGDGGGEEGEEGGKEDGARGVHCG